MAPARSMALPRAGGWRVRATSPSRVALYQVLLLAVLLGAREIAIRTGFLPVFLYGQPSGIVAKGWTLLLSGELV